MKFNENPISLVDFIDNERFFYNKIVELENDIIQLKKSEKRLSNQIYGMTVKQKDYIPIKRLDLMTEKIREKGYASADIIEKEKIKYALEILYQLRFKLEGE